MYKTWFININKPSTIYCQGLFLNVFVYKSSIVVSICSCLFFDSDFFMFFSSNICVCEILLAM